MTRLHSDANGAVTKVGLLRSLDWVEVHINDAVKIARCRRRDLGEMLIVSLLTLASTHITAWP